jgi:C4-dicarboxylate transporter
MKVALLVGLVAGLGTAGFRAFMSYASEEAAELALFAVGFGFFSMLGWALARGIWPADAARAARLLRDRRSREEGAEGPGAL